MLEGIVAIGTDINAGPGGVVLEEVDLMRGIVDLGRTLVETAPEAVISEQIGQVGTREHTDIILQVG